jgi:nucleoid DNA-binding protein
LTGEEIEIAASQYPAFTASKSWKEALKGQFKPDANSDDA